MLKLNLRIIPVTGYLALFLVLLILFVDIPGSLKLLRFIADTLTGTSYETPANKRFLDMRPLILLAWIYFAILKAFQAVNYFQTKNLDNIVQLLGVDSNYAKTGTTVYLKFISVLIIWLCVFYIGLALVFEILISKH